MQNGLGEFTEQQRDVALAFLSSLNGDYKAAARKAKVAEKALRYWADGGNVQTSNGIILAGDGRPYPPSSMMDPLRYPETFEPAHELADWVNKTFIAVNGPLYNPDHSHLVNAHIGFLWTNVPNQRQMKQIAGTAAIPFAQGDKWAKARANHQLAGWFGAVPDFVITLDTVFCSLSEDATFCALVEHEMYHCAQQVDEYGSPKFGKDGKAKFGIRDHDVSEFIPVIDRYGAGASTSPIMQMVKAAMSMPTVATASIASACGTCNAQLT